MDVFKFNNPTSATKMEYGELINNFESKMWIERYRNNGEFTFTALTSSGMRTKLPIGSFVSHLDTKEIMIVENHEITENKGENSIIVITGRGFETITENRIVGSNKVFPTSGPIPDYVLAPDYSWNQAIALTADHIKAASLIDDNNAIPWVNIIAEVVGTSESVQRTVKRGTLYSRILELLEVDDLGVKIVRPGAWGDPDNVVMVFHKGIDRTTQVIFSYDTGEIETADYLWSNKKLKNAALVSGRWVETVVLPTEINYDRRMMYVDASDLDNAYSSPPTGSDLTNVLNAMTQRGLEALAAQKDVALTKAEVSRNNVRSRYRIDFNVGDLITVSGDYNEIATKRVSEYVEIEDRTGKSGYPTLTAI